MCACAWQRHAPRSRGGLLLPRTRKADTHPKAPPPLLLLRRTRKDAATQESDTRGRPAVPREAASRRCTALCVCLSALMRLSVCLVVASATHTRCSPGKAGETCQVCHLTAFPGAVSRMSDRFRRDLCQVCRETRQTRLARPACLLACVCP